LNIEAPRLEVIRPVVDVAIIDAREFQLHAGLLIEVFSGLAGEDGGDETLEADAGPVDHRLRLIHDFLFGLDQGQIQRCLRNGIGNSQIDFGLLLESLDDLTGHVVAKPYWPWPHR
jgi:hypothetical protein